MAQQVMVLDVKRPDVVAHSCNPNISVTRWKMKTGESLGSSRAYHLGVCRVTQTRDTHTHN